MFDSLLKWSTPRNRYNLIPYFVPFVLYIWHHRASSDMWEQRHYLYMWLKVCCRMAQYYITGSTCYLFYGGPGMLYSIPTNKLDSCHGNAHFAAVVCHDCSASLSARFYLAIQKRYRIPAVLHSVWCCTTRLTDIELSRCCRYDGRRTDQEEPAVNRQQGSHQRRTREAYQRRRRHCVMTMVRPSCRVR